MAFYRRLGELLLAAGTISQEELDRGLELQKTQKGRLGAGLRRAEEYRQAVLRRPGAHQEG